MGSFALMNKEEEFPTVPFLRRTGSGALLLYEFPEERTIGSLLFFYPFEVPGGWQLLGPKLTGLEMQVVQ